MAYVAVHKDTDQALGRLANAELREAKKEAHFYFDQIAKTSLINKVWKKHIPNTSNRDKAYLWLSNQLNIPREVIEKWLKDGDWRVRAAAMNACQKKWH